MKTHEISVLIQKTMPECCRRTVLDFAKLDRYQGGGEPGDQLRCGCGNWLIYGTGRRVMGWRLKDSGAAEGDA